MLGDRITCRTNLDEVILRKAIIDHMILGTHPTASEPSLRMLGGVTIDAMFRQMAARQPEVLALVDAPNRASFTDGPSRRLTYRQANVMIDAIAARLRYVKLPADAVVAIQMPNTVEHILTLLAVLRAGMIVAPLPPLWRRAEAVAALSALGTKALLTCGRLGNANTDHCQFAMEVAAEVFSIRCVGGFGHDLPDGVVPFDDLFAETRAGNGLSESRDRAADHVAMLTFEVGRDGIVPVARSHGEVLAAGLAVVLESRLPQGAKILSTITPSSFGGIVLTLLPWLFSGGTLTLHQPFDAEIFAERRHAEACDTLILPGAVALGLAGTGLIADAANTRVIAAWRTPEQMSASAAWTIGADLIDVPIFGEAALLPMRRGDGGWPSAISLGAVVLPRGNPSGIRVLELARTHAGTLAVGGAMVPHHCFPPGVENSSLPHFAIGPHGLVDTLYPCTVLPDGSELELTGSPDGIVAVGFYRIPAKDLQSVCSRYDNDSRLEAVADPLLGRRLIGTCSSASTLPATLAAAGANPLMIAAFRDRGERLAPEHVAAPARPAAVERASAAEPPFHSHLQKRTALTRR